LIDRAAARAGGVRDYFSTVEQPQRRQQQWRPEQKGNGENGKDRCHWRDPIFAVRSPLPGSSNYFGSINIGHDKTPARTIYDEPGPGDTIVEAFRQYKTPVILSIFEKHRRGLAG